MFDIVQQKQQQSSNEQQFCDEEKKNFCAILIELEENGAVIERVEKMKNPLESWLFNTLNAFQTHPDAKIHILLHFLNFSNHLFPQKIP